MNSSSYIDGLYHLAMGHVRTGPKGQPSADDDPPAADLDQVTAAAVAQTMQALAAPSRLLILSRLRREPCTVTKLAEDVGMEQSAVSHQLRLLRHLGLVTGTRQGRSTVYALYDDHVDRLLDEAVYHCEHLRLGLRDRMPEEEQAELRQGEGVTVGG
jgi:ArsR family transcriptional regulator, nickel/cobalt-responsive transcriptional repressor